MKNQARLLIALIAADHWLGADSVTPIQAQSYSIPWHQISAGQGTSSNGQFQLTGTTGQHDAHATLRGGTYALTGGFWSFITAVAAPGAPELTMTLTGLQTAVISWPAPSTGFILQQNSTLNSGTWADVTDPVTSTPVANQVEVTFSAGITFYRLIRH